MSTKNESPTTFPIAIDVDIDALDAVNGGLTVLGVNALANQGLGARGINASVGYPAISNALDYSTFGNTGYATLGNTVPTIGWGYGSDPLLGLGAMPAYASYAAPSANVLPAPLQLGTVLAASSLYGMADSFSAITQGYGGGFDGGDFDIDDFED